MSVETIVDSLTWRKTTYIEPHEYIVRAHDPENFDKIAAHLETITYDGFFGKTPYKYSDIGEYRYWRIDIIINRALNSPDYKGPFRRATK